MEGIAILVIHDVLAALRALNCASAVGNIAMHSSFKNIAAMLYHQRGLSFVAEWSTLFLLDWHSTSTCLQE